MWKVICSYNIGENWEDIDRQIYRLAGQRSHASGAECDSKNPNAKIRDHVWYTETFEEAKAMHGRLRSMEGVKAYFREA